MIIGMFWNKNEADLLPFTLPAAIKAVDVLYVADDGSTDNSWDIIQSYSKQIEHIQREPNKKDPAQRQSLLDKIRSRYRYEDNWIQIIESDIILLETNVKDAIAKYAVDDVAMSWHTLNAVRKPGTWEGADEFPNWSKHITEIMPYTHYMERMLYTYRPMPGLHFSAGVWRPWPSGFSRYSSKPLDEPPMTLDAPLLYHGGFRGPTHFKQKFAKMGNRHSKYTTWDLTSRESILQTVSFFNGQWNNNKIFPATRAGWIQYLNGKI